MDQTTQTAETTDQRLARIAGGKLDERGRACCPRCDAELMCFSPSGRGDAACDGCHTVWEE